MQRPALPSGDSLSNEGVLMNHHTCCARDRDFLLFCQVFSILPTFGFEHEILKLHFFFSLVF